MVTPILLTTTTQIAIITFTHSGSQINDWTPQGTTTTERNLYPQFIAFIQESIKDLWAKGHPVELAGVFYHLGENDTAYGPYRRDAAKWLQSMVVQSRRDLALPSLRWFVSQQKPVEETGLNKLDITADLAAIAAGDSNFVHLRAFDLMAPEDKLVVRANGAVELGRLLADGYIKQAR